MKTEWRNASNVENIFFELNSRLWKRDVLLRRKVRRGKRLRKIEFVIRDDDSSTTFSSLPMNIIRKSHYVNCVRNGENVGKIHFIKKCFSLDCMADLRRMILAEKKFWKGDIDRTRGLSSHAFVKTMFRAGRRNMKGILNFIYIVIFFKKIHYRTLSSWS